MKSATFTGKDEIDIEIQLWDWRSSNPTAVVKRKYAIERLEPRMKPPKKYDKILAVDTVSMRIDYE